MSWFALFTLTGKEEQTVEYIKKEEKINEIQVFAPKREFFFKKNGVYKKETKLLFPSYIFMEAEIRNVHFSMYMKPLLVKNPYIIKVLGDSINQNYSLSSCDIEILSQLLDEDYCMKASNGFIDGDTVYITDGPLIGREGQIKNIDRHKRQATIEFEFIGCIQRMNVPLNILSKTS